MLAVNQDVVDLDSSTDSDDDEPLGVTPSETPLKEPDYPKETEPLPHKAPPPPLSAKLTSPKPNSLTSKARTRSNSSPGVDKTPPAPAPSPRIPLRPTPGPTSPSVEEPRRPTPKEPAPSSSAPASKPSVSSGNPVVPVT